MRPLSLSAETQVWALEEESRLNIILMLGDCGQRMTLEVVLRYWSSKLAKIPIFDCKVHLWCVLTVKWHLRWIKKPRIDSSFGGKLGLVQSFYCKRYYAWIRLWTWILCGNVFQRCDRENYGGYGISNHLIEVR